MAKATSFVLVIDSRDSMHFLLSLYLFDCPAFVFRMNSRKTFRDH